MFKNPHNIANNTTLTMERAEEELEKRSKFLKSLIKNKKTIEQQEQHQHFNNNNVKIRACDMPLTLQNHAFRCARHLLDSMPPKKLHTKRLALTLKKVTLFFFILFCIVLLIFAKICFWVMIFFFFLPLGEVWMVNLESFGYSFVIFFFFFYYVCWTM